MNTIAHYVLIAVFIFSYTQCAHLKSIADTARIATRLQATRHSHASKEQLHITQKFKKIVIPPDKDTLPLLEKIITGLSYTKTFPRISENADLIIKATQFFYAIKGFNNVLKRVITSANNESCKGPLFEIETAYTITQNDPNEIIHSFNENLYDRTEIDILTNLCAYECKCILWQKADEKKLKKQFLNQKKLIELYNSLQKKNIAYRIVSKRKIPQKWRSWADDNDIVILD